MPTAATTTYTNDRLTPYYRPDKADIINVPLAVSTTFAAGTVLGKVTSGGRYAAYNDALSTGVEVARLILERACSTDASGNVTLEGEFGQTYPTAPAFICGYFLIADLTGYDAAAAVDLNATIIDGTILHIAA